MIKIFIYNDPLNIDYADFIDFEFEKFDYPICQNLIETCLKNGKTIQIFEAKEDKFKEG